MTGNTPDQTEAVADESGAPTIKKSAVPDTPPAPVEAPQTTKPKGGRSRGWTSGWCGGMGTCNDGRMLSTSGEPLRRCQGFGENGANVNPRIILCACECHAEDRSSDEG